MYEDLHCRQPVVNPAVQALTRALRCAMLCRDCRDQCFQPVESTVRFFFSSEHMVCDDGIRKNLYAVVVLSGDTTIFQGMMEHVTRLIHPEEFVRSCRALDRYRRALAPSSMKIKVVAQIRRFPNRNIIAVTPNISVVWKYCSSHVLPDGNIITVVSNASCCAKLLFQSNFTSNQVSGVHDTSFRCFMEITR